MNSLVSIIVPIYNVEIYLEKCLQSIISQTYENLQIILIDDGSLDCCPQICEEYSKKDKRIIVIHQKNSGVSSARNTGLEVARGAYISFIDPDDYVYSDMIEKMLYTSETETSDIVICDYNRVNYNGEIYGNNCIEQNTGKVEMMSLYDSQMVYFTEPYKRSTLVVLWNKLYKAEVFREVRFPVGKINEDESVTYKLLYNAKKIAYLKLNLYNYLERKGSIMDMKIGRERFYIFDAYMERICFYYEKQETVLCKKMIFHYMHMLCQYIDWSTKAPNGNKNEISHYYLLLRKLIRNNKIRFNIKEKVEILSFDSIKLYFKIWKFKKG